MNRFLKKLVKPIIKTLFKKPIEADMVYAVLDDHDWRTGLQIERKILEEYGCRVNFSRIYPILHQLESCEKVIESRWLDDDKPERGGARPRGYRRKKDISRSRRVIRQLLIPVFS